MRFGINTFIWSESFGRANLSLLPRLKERGFRSIELPLLDPVAANDFEVRCALRENELDCTFCSVFVPGHSFISNDAAVRSRTVDHMRACIYAAAEMGAELVCGPLYAPVGELAGRRRTQAEWQRAVECLQRLLPDLDAAQVRLAIEPLNRFETYFLNTIADSVALCRDVGHPRVGILLDTFHANIEEKNLAAACDLAGNLLFHIHASENDRGVPGTGHVQWEEMFAWLHCHNYSGWMTIESFNFSGGVLPRLVCIWRDLAAAPEDVAFKGLKYLETLDSGQK